MLEERSGNLNKALGAYEKAVEQDPQALEVYRDIAQVNLRLGKPDAAQRAAEKIRDLAPSDPASYIFLGNVHVAQGNLEEAAKAYEEALALDPKNLRALENLGNYYALTEPEKALSYYQRYLKLEPKDGEMFFQMGMVQHKAGKIKDAIASFQKSLELDPRQVAPHLAIAEIYETRASTAAAIAEFEKAAAIQPGHPLIHSRLGQLYYSQGNRDAAETNFRKALEGQPLEPTVNYWISRLAEEQQQWGQAADSIKRSYEGSQDPQFLPLLAYYLTLDKRPAEAVAWLEKARDVQKDNPNVLLFLGINYLELGKTDSALEALSQGAIVSPDDPQMRFQLGVARDRAGRFSEAVADFQAVLKADPNHAAALNYLGYSWADRGENLDQAEALLRKAVALEPDNGAFLDSLGWVRFKQGHYGEAIQLLERAARLTEDPLVFDHLGDACLAAGQVTKAAEAWQSALRIDPANTAVANKLKLLSARMELGSDPRKLLKSIEGNFRQIQQLASRVAVRGKIKRQPVQLDGALTYSQKGELVVRFPGHPTMPAWSVSMRQDRIAITPEEFADGLAPKTLEPLKTLPLFFSGDYTARLDRPEVTIHSENDLLHYDGGDEQLWVDPLRGVITRVLRKNPAGGKDELEFETWQQIEGIWLPAKLRLRNRSRGLDTKVSFSEWTVK